MGPKTFWRGILWQCQDYPWKSGSLFIILITIGIGIGTWIAQ